MRELRVLWSGVALACVLGTALADQPVPARQAELTRLVRDDCGSCHGRKLTGGLGPPLIAAALGAKPAESLKYTILFGRRGTPMPAWRPLLSDAEADWIIARLLEGFPDAR
jgi:cytochrome c55X